MMLDPSGKAEVSLTRGACHGEADVAEVLLTR